MKSVIRTGNNINEAVELALIELDATRVNVEVEVLEEGSKGIFGIFGTKEAKVLVTLNENAHKVAKEFLKSIFEKMNMDVKINVKIDENVLNIDLSGDQMALLIGKRGQTLDSIQYLVSLFVNRNREDYIRVVLDTENYREKRTKTLEKLAQRMADKARKMRKDIRLEPMNPYERRIIHSTLQNSKFVSTKSDGEDPNRRVIIFLKR
ncbi:MAG: RNA-binding cell elongation regulator Jag/EloR [Bacillota bacterium]|nr:RNA-binding cell elongation regulator Jag/EloR [Bacillota bacterium]